MYLLLILSELEQDRSGLSVVNGGSESAIALLRMEGVVKRATFCESS